MKSRLLSGKRDALNEKPPLFDLLKLYDKGTDRENKLETNPRIVYNKVYTNKKNGHTYRIPDRREFADYKGKKYTKFMSCVICARNGEFGRLFDIYVASAMTVS